MSPLDPQQPADLSLPQPTVPAPDSERELETLSLNQAPAFDEAPTLLGREESEGLDRTIDSADSKTSSIVHTRHPAWRRFGEYELLSEIARGGMGVVYKAMQIKLRRIVALKMILSGQLASKHDIKRFYLEAEAAARLEHSGIVPIYEVGEHEGQHYFSMAFVEGISLGAAVANNPLPPLKAAQVTKVVAEAMAYAHEHGVIHRDLKPANGPWSAASIPPRL